MRFMEHRAEHPDLADLFMQLSGEELHHMQLLSDMLAAMVKTLHEKYKES